MTINDNEYKMLSYIVKKYFQTKVDKVKLGAHLLKDDYPTIVEDITDDIEKYLVSTVEGIIMCYKNGLLYENRLARIIERKKIRNAN